MTIRRRSPTGRAGTRRPTARPSGALVAAGARPAAAGRAWRSPGKLAVRARAVRWPPGAAAVGDLRDASSELARDRRTCSAMSLATLLRVAAGFGLGVVAGTLARRDRRLFGADARAARSDPAGAARDPVDRLGAAVHPVARHFRGLEDHADRGRRVLSGLSRRDGRDPVGRSQDRRGRPRVPAVRRRHGAAHPAAGGAAGLCACRCAPGSGSAGCSWSRPNSWARPKGSAIS